MLIVDNPMPSRCFECFARLSCERYTQELEMVDDFEELKALLPNDKCLIKGEMVRCGECRWWSKDEPDDEYGYCYNGKIIGSTKENWYCADGERKEKTQLMESERRKMMSKEKLEPCPFCGYEHPNIMFKNGYGAFVISCEQCGTVFHFQAGEREKIKDRLISAWNRRADE